MSANGFGKKTSLKEYKVQKRGGSGVKTAKVTSKTGKLIVAKVLTGEEEELIAMSKKGQVIRTALKEGRPEDATRLMGHPFTVEGRVEHGDGRGRLLGFPTANMQIDGYIRPAFGIYAARVAILEDDKIVSRHEGVANLGIRPMYRSAEPLLEAFLFDFSGDLYGKHLAVDLLAYLRPEAKFAGVEELKKQIEKDVEKAKKALASICLPPPGAG